MPFNDNREFIRALESTGDVVRIRKEVDWDLEAGAICRRALEMYGPAVLFEKLKDYPEGYRILGGPLATYRRVAVALGLAADTPVKNIYEEYERREGKTVSPTVVKDGPCKENIMLGEDIDLFCLPAPMVHEGDGGRYIGTWGFTVCRDPDTGWTNWGMYRFMILNQRSLSGMPTPASDFARIFREKYLSGNRAMPVALVIGADPISSMVSTSGYRVGKSEADFAGALNQQPVALIKCETNDLLVPAHAEIIIEGEILPDMLGPEGPFGEYTGYRVGEYRPKVFFRVTAITHRNSPIVTMCVHGIPGDEGHVGGAIGTGITLKRRLRNEGLPVTGVFLPPEGASHLVVVGVSSGGSEVCRKVKEVICRGRVWYTKIIVVDDDVDIYNLGEVIHAFSVKCHSYHGIVTSEEPGKGGPVTPCYRPEERERRYGAVALFDATWPSDWPEAEIPVKSSFRTIYPPEIQEKVIRDWLEYGF